VMPFISETPCTWLHKS